MRHFVPKRNNLYKLPHDTYMQMMYLVKDYDRMKNDKNITAAKLRITAAVEKAAVIMEREYEKRSETHGKLKSLQAFFDYPYYSYMFARRYSDMGASKNSWGLFRSHFAYLIAEELMLL